MTNIGLFFVLFDVLLYIFVILCDELNLFFYRILKFLGLVNIIF